MSKFNGVLYRGGSSALGNTRLICYEPSDFLRVSRDVRLFCYKCGKICVTLSALGSEYLKVPNGTYAILIKDTERISAKALIKLIEQLAAYQCYIYLDIDNEGLAEYIRGYFNSELPLFNRK